MSSSKVQQVASKSSLVSSILSKENFKYLFTTHFWGPVSNFGIPLAAIADLKKDPEMISGPMTGSLIVYSAVFMKYSVAIQPKNYLLFACHAINEAAQLGQGYRWLDHHYLSKKE
ncbi:pyruvate transporter [Saccharomycopsis crataegensis]|uniref:Mitochondrial pyruvate carrier n=1 Tax=Saccharomycopsis crataegensis TaxID=43959 RepID=A0AAV5QM95_9ASCO|nr:pyruvate transporter [Saccharomycopsis crataegensis]